MRFIIDANKRDQFEEEATPFAEQHAISFHMKPGTSMPRMNGATVIGYADGFSQPHVEVHADYLGPDYIWYDKLRDVPMCNDQYAIIPQRWMEKLPDGRITSVGLDLTRVHGLHHLAFRFRRPGDRTLVPSVLAYSLALSFGDVDGVPAKVSDRLFTLDPLRHNHSGVSLPPVLGDTEHERGLRFITSYPFIRPEDISLLCTLRRAVPTGPGYLGEIGVRMEMVLKVTDIKGPISGDYGDRYLAKMVTPEGHRVNWWTGDNLDLEVGQMYTVKATPKRHEDDVTEILRLKRSEVA